jgi:hypothetical protein
LQDLLQQIQSAWFLVSVALFVAIVLRERQHMGFLARHKAEYDEFVKDCEKRLADSRAALEAEYNERLKIIAKSKNMIWIKGEISESGTNSPPGSETH